jgi:ATP-dependent helicase/nuclease subunit A
MSALVIPRDALERQRTASDPVASVWVSANAGSGKTHVLAQRVLRLLLSGVPPAKILCLTFTKAAAANMATQILSRLADWTHRDDAALAAAIERLGAPPPQAADLKLARRLFARTVETPGGLKIQTIHAFCERLLHLFPFEANVPARFEVVEEVQSAELLDQARDAVLAEALHDTGPLGASLAALLGDMAEADFNGLIREALLHRARDAAGFSFDPEALRRALGLEQGETVEVIERRMIEEGIVPARWRALAAVLGTGMKTDQDRAESLLRALATYETSVVESVGYAACLDDYCDVFLASKDAPRATQMTKKLGQGNPDLLAAMEQESLRLAALKGRHRAAATLARSAALLTIVHAVVVRYDRMKSMRGLLDFADLVERTRAMLQRSSAQWVLYKLDAGIDHVLVDEAQDTSATQWTIFAHLTEDFAGGATAHLAPRSFFAVGDDKQSIFSFQGAAPAMFEDMRRSYARRFRHAGLFFEEVRLKHSFRSVPGVLAMVDAVFAQVEHQAGLVAAGDSWPGHEAVRAHLPGLVEVWPPEAPAEAPANGSWRLPLDIADARDPASLVAERVARKIATLTAPGSGELAWDKDADHPRPVRPGDILILVRTRGPFFSEVIRALKRCGVPVAGADRLELSAHIACLDLIAAGRVALLPQDDLMLAAVLKSPLIGFDDDDLLALAPGRTGSLFDALAEASAPRHRAAHATIVRWRARVAATPFAFYAELLGADGGRRALEASLGPEACDVVDEFLRLALAHEREPAPALSRFLDGLEGAGLEIKRDMEAGADAVRVMTVHAAKGLEAKIVFLPDTCSVPMGSHPPKLFALPDEAGNRVLAWSPRKDLDPPAVTAAREAALAQSAEEYRRLLYVALTRAEERLYIAGFHGVRNPHAACWNSMVRPVAEGFETAPAFWDDAVEIRRRLTPGTVAAGSRAPVLAPVALPDETPAWLGQPAPAETAPAPPLRPSSQLGAADERAADPNGPPRPAALRRGRLMHLLMQHLPDVPVAQRADRGRAFLKARAGDLPDATRDRWVEAALALIADPAHAALFGPDARAEVAVAGKLTRPDGGVVEVLGRVDRLAETATEVLVADFKTGAPAADLPAAYWRQMALYRAVLAPLWPDKPLRMVVIWTEGPKVDLLDGARLDAALAAMFAAGPGLS